MANKSVIVKTTSGLRTYDYSLYDRITVILCDGGQLEVSLYAKERTRVLFAPGYWLSVTEQYTAEG